MAGDCESTAAGHGWLYGRLSEASGPWAYTWADVEWCLSYSRSLSPSGVCVVWTGVALAAAIGGGAVVGRRTSGQRRDRPLSSYLNFP